MAQAPLLFNPEVRIAPLHALGRLLWLLCRALRWRAPRGGCQAICNGTARSSLAALSETVFRGFGEVEFHLHHGRDTHETMLTTLRSRLDWFNRFGAMPPTVAMAGGADFPSHGGQCPC